MLQVLYNYIKLIDPNERVYLLDSRIYIRGFGGSYLEVCCTGNRFVAQSYDLNPKWLHKIFKVHRVSLDKVRDAIPPNVIVVTCNKFYTLYPRNEELFKDD